jgi:UDP-N-acetylglucosamine diphosphorylase/glucosamine-1-phosphate N-acetyltransferase
MATHRPTIVFDDGHAMLAPLTDLRASFLIRTGAHTTLERHCANSSLNITGVWVPERGVALTREQTALPVNTATAGECLFINGRLSLMRDEVLALKSGECLKDEEGAIVACVGPGSLGRLLCGSQPPAMDVRGALERVLASRPWHVRRDRDACLAHDLAMLSHSVARIASPGLQVALMGDRLHAHAGATVCPATIFDTTLGPIVLDHGAVVRPGAILIGPCYVGPMSTVLERATIRPGTAIGPSCKVNGEVGGTIFQGFSNKAHDGYLGDSYVGEWANLGAGTTNSNLLNTYGEVISRAQPGSKHERTGEQFLGAIIGDHCKFAIQSRIMTGSILHTGGMFAPSSPISGTTHAFTWATDSGSSHYRSEKFLDVMIAVMKRRAISPSTAYVARVRELCDRAAHSAGARV